MIPGRLRQRKLKLNEKIVDGFLHGIDQIEEMINNITAE